jgi:hypothetical protein
MRPIDGELAMLLQVGPAVPGIDLTRFGLDPHGRTVAHIHIVARGDVTRYVMEFPVGGDAAGSDGVTPLGGVR